MLHDANTGIRGLNSISVLMLESHLVVLPFAAPSRLGARNGRFRRDT